MSEAALAATVAVAILLVGVALLFGWVQFALDRDWSPFVAVAPVFVILWLIAFFGVWYAP